MHHRKRRRGKGRVIAAAACLLATSATSSCVSLTESGAEDLRPTVARTEPAAGPRRSGSLLVNVPPPLSVGGAAATAMAAAPAAPTPPAALARIEPRPVAAPAAALPIAAVPPPAPPMAARIAAPAVAAPQPQIFQPAPQLVYTASFSSASVSNVATVPLSRPKIVASGNLDDHYRRRLAEQGTTVPAAPKSAPQPVAVYVEQYQPLAKVETPRSGATAAGADYRVLEDHYRRRLAQFEGGLPGDSLAGAPVVVRAD